MMVNLLENALDACRLDVDETEHRIAVRLAGHDDHVRFEVEDNGIGMDRETCEKAFTLFFSSKGTGTGLGLFISDKIARAHGGEARSPVTSFHQHRCSHLSRSTVLYGRPCLPPGPRMPQDRHLRIRIRSAGGMAPKDFQGGVDFRPVGPCGRIRRRRREARGARRQRPATLASTFSSARAGAPRGCVKGFET